MTLVTLTGVRCTECGASFSPVVEGGAGEVQVTCPCGKTQTVHPGRRREPAPPRQNVLGLCLSECAAAFDGVSSHGRAREVVDALRAATRLDVDALTLARLRRIMGISP